MMMGEGVLSITEGGNMTGLTSWTHITCAAEAAYGSPCHPITKPPPGLASIVTMLLHPSLLQCGCVSATASIPQQAQHISSGLAWKSSLSGLSAAATPSGSEATAQLTAHLAYITVHSHAGRLAPA